LEVRVALEIFANDGTAIVTSGGTTAPAAGTVESWTLVSSTLPAVSSTATPPSWCYITDQASDSEKMLVTNISGSTATVTRGADGTTPVVHTAGFTVNQVATRASLIALQSVAPVAVQTSNYTAGTGQLIPVDASSGNVQVQLPTAPADMTRITVKMINTNQAQGYTVSVLPGSGDVFNNTGNTAPRTLSLLNQAVSLQYEAANTTWYVLGDDLPLTQVKNLFPDWLNVKNWGATGNGKMVTDAAISASGTTLTSASAAFTSGDVGKLVVIMGAGALNGSVGIPLAGTITGFTNSTTVTISATATTTVSAATCYYGTDDQAKISATIAQAASGQAVFLPAGIYLMSTELSIQKPIRLTGAGATIVTTNSAAINFGNTYISAASGASTSIGLEIDHLVFDVTGGHVFYNTNFNKFTFHDLRLVQRSYNFAIWYSTNATANQLDGYFHNIVSRVNGAPRSVQAWYILSSIGGGMAMCKWQNCLWQNNDGDTTQWYCEFDCTGTHNYTNLLTFDNCWFDRAFGGCIKLMSAQAATFHDCNIIDSYSQTINGGTVQWGSNSAYYIGAYSGGSNWASEKISFIDCSRDLQGPTGSTAWDIECESTSDTITVQNYLVRDIPGVSTFFPQFNFNGCTNVLVLNCPDTVITNSGTSQVELGPSGNVSFTGSLTGATEPSVALPSDQGYISWTLDPSSIQGVSGPGTGNLYVAAFYLRVGATISDVAFWINNGGAFTMTSGENFAGIWSNTGTLLASTADLSSTWAPSATGIKTSALTSPPALTAGWYWMGILTNWTTSPGPQFGRGTSQIAGNVDAANAGTSAGSSRYGVISAFGTSLGNFTPSNLNASAPPITLWGAVK
jgi:Pectate lyase superfamily protein